MNCLFWCFLYCEDLSRMHQTLINPSARTATIIPPTTSWRVFPTNRQLLSHLSFSRLLPPQTLRQLKHLLPQLELETNPPVQRQGPLTRADPWQDTQSVPLARRALQKTMEAFVWRGHRGEVSEEQLEPQWIDPLLTSPLPLSLREPWRWLQKHPSPNHVLFTQILLKSGSQQPVLLPRWAWERVSGEEEVLHQGLWTTSHVLCSRWQRRWVRVSFLGSLHVLPQHHHLLEGRRWVWVWMPAVRSRRETPSQRALQKTCLRRSALNLNSHSVKGTCLVKVEARLWLEVFQATPVFVLYFFYKHRSSIKLGLYLKSSM